MTIYMNMKIYGYENVKNIYMKNITYENKKWKTKNTKIFKYINI